MKGLAVVMELPGDASPMVRFLMLYAFVMILIGGRVSFNC